jgi:hypothetical protein
MIPIRYYQCAWGLRDEVCHVHSTNVFCPKHRTILDRLTEVAKRSTIRPI